MLPADITAPAIGRAFGVDIETTFRLPGLPPPALAPPAPHARLQLARRADLLRPKHDAEVLTHQRAADGRTSLRVTRDDGGFSFHARGWGAFHITSDGCEVRCAPLRMATWRWQRYLIGQILPFVSVVHDYEVFHASVVTKDNRTIALTGGSNAGKSSLATAFMLRGWQLLADDVLIANLDANGDVIAHRGTALTSLRFDAQARLTEDEVARLGKPIGRDEEAVRIATEPASAAASALTHLIVLERQPAGPPVEPIAAVDPKTLIASTFNLLIRTPDRLLRQLDMCHRISSRVHIARGVVTGELGPSELAARIERYVDATPGTVRTS